MRILPRFLPAFLFVLALVGLSACGEKPVATNKDNPAAHLPKHAPHTDHSTFFLTKKFETGPDVTRACLECHPTAATEIMKTSHWNWMGDEEIVPGHEDKGKMRIGKKNLINNFCIGVTSNWDGCTKCHAGYGWKDETFDFSKGENVDCLICHETSGSYNKNAGAGLPDEHADLNAAAASVALPKRTNCGACHFDGGGGDAVKHGDLDRTLMNPSNSLDVHMGEHDMSCIDCHQAEHHNIPGRALSLSETSPRVSCTDCHNAAPHNDKRLDGHAERIACQTCHIPVIARERATKMTWDWSQAGQDRDTKDHHVYMKIKGSFKYEHDVKPQYAWWNGKTKRYLVGDTINPEEITNLTIPVGSKDDKDAKLWPFKVHVAKQPYDIQSKMLLVPNTVGPDGYWTLFDWDKAFKNGTKAVRESPDNGYDLQYTGEFGFAETETYWALSHMVTHAKDALSCEDCHGQNGRMKWSDLGYDADPLGRDELEHEEVTLKDADGEPVVKSGKALSMKTTCGECHELDDDNFKARHNFHKTELAETLSHEREKCLGLESLVPTDEGEMNCLICHLKDVNTRRMRENRGTDWMSAAGLSDDYLSKTQSGFEWNKETLGKEGTVELALIHTTEHTCGDCHGGTDKGEKFLKFELGKRSSWKTEETGEVFSGRRISNSGMNLEGKDKLVQPWDVHAERLVHCTDCHAATERPKRASHGKVLRKNQIKVGEPVQCLSCHNTAGSHNDLPNAPQHMGSVSCESCHIPKLHMAARQMVDETVVETNGESSVFYRGIKGGEFKSAAETLISGYTPTLGISLASGKAKIAPMNLISTWRWMDGEKKVVPAAMLAKVFLEGTTYKPVIIKALDKDSDGKVSRLELRLDSDAKVKIVADLLAKEGVDGAHIAALTTTHAIHHNVMPAPFVKLRCERCHVSAEKSEATVEIAPYLPGGVKPTLDKNGSVKTSGEFKKNQDGSLIFVPTMVQDQFKKCRSLKDASK